MNDTIKYSLAIDAIISYKGCSFREANDFLIGHSTLPIDKANYDGKVEIFKDSAWAMREWYQESRAWPIMAIYEPLPT